MWSADKRFGHAKRRLIKNVTFHSLTKEILMRIAQPTKHGVPLRQMKMVSCLRASMMNAILTVVNSSRLDLMAEWLVV